MPTAPVLWSHYQPERSCVRPSSGCSLNIESQGPLGPCLCSGFSLLFGKERNVSELCVRGQWECPGALSPGAAEEGAGGEEQLLSGAALSRDLRATLVPPRAPLRGINSVTEAERKPSVILPGLSRSFFQWGFAYKWTGF